MALSSINIAYKGDFLTHTINLVEAKKLVISDIYLDERTALPTMVSGRGIEWFSKEAMQSADLKQVEARVHPTMIPFDNMLSNVNGTLNAISVSGDAVGDILLYGHGAGMMPTASAVIGDVVDIARNLAFGAPARVRNQNGYVVSGRVIRLLSDLESEGRMARLLVEVQNPLGHDPGETPHPPLILGEYVRVDIQGRVLDDVFRIPRTALRDNARIWLANENGTLEIRSVEPLWRDAEYVLLREGFAVGDRLITSDLTAAVDGMAIRLLADSPPPSGAPAKSTTEKTNGKTL